MSRYTDQLSRAHTAINGVLRERVTGTADNERKVKLIDWALEHADAWAADQPPRNGLGAVGGSSAPQETADREESDRVKRMSAAAVVRIPEITKQVDALMTELYQIVQRLTGIVNAEKLPADVPGCRNCAKVLEVKGQKIGGHFAPVGERGKLHKLCDFCWRHAVADAREKGVEEGIGEPPSVVICDVFHRQGKRLAGLMMAKQRAKAS